MKILFSLSFIAAFVLTSCVPVNYPTDVKVPFTTDLYNKLTAGGHDIKKIQFYNSMDILLRRELSNEEAKIAQGKVEINDGKFIETIIIKAETPGVCEAYDNKSLTISFEAGKSLIFAAPTQSNDFYRIAASDWKNNTGIVKYGDNLYFILPQSSKSCLLVAKKQISNITEQIKVVPGRTVE